MVSIEKIQQLREETGFSVMECKKALEESTGNFEKAKEFLKKRGKGMMEKKAKRTTQQGIIDSYIHPNKKIGVMIKLCCESDFVAKSEDFKNLAHELCLQIAAINPEENSLISQPWIKDESKTVKDLIEEHIAKTGENVIIKKFIRYEL